MLPPLPSGLALAMACAASSVLLTKKPR